MTGNETNDFYFNSTDHLCVLCLILDPETDELCPRASSSDLTDYDVPGFNEEDNFGDDELTDGKSSSSERLSSDRTVILPSAVSSHTPHLLSHCPIPSLQVVDNHLQRKWTFTAKAETVWMHL